MILRTITARTRHRHKEKDRAKIGSRPQNAVNASQILTCFMVHTDKSYSCIRLANPWRRFWCFLTLFQTSVHFYVGSEMRLSDMRVQYWAKQSYTNWQISENASSVCWRSCEWPANCVNDSCPSCSLCSIGVCSSDYKNKKCCDWWPNSQLHDEWHKVNWCGGKC